jgi:hypothetical protein
VAELLRVRTGVPMPEVTGEGEELFTEPRGWVVGRWGSLGG